MYYVLHFLTGRKTLHEVSESAFFGFSATHDNSASLVFTRKDPPHIPTGSVKWTVFLSVDSYLIS